MRWNALWILACCCLLAACSSSSRREKMQEKSMEETRTAIDHLRQEFVEAYNRGDAAAVAGFYAKDAVVAPPGRPALRGRAAIQAALEELFAGHQVSFRVEPEETVVAPKWAAGAGQAFETLTPKEKGETVELKLNYLLLFRRQSDGTWAIARSVLSAAPVAAGVSKK